MNNFEFKYSNLERAYEKLKIVAAIYDGSDDVVRDSLIQRFEFTFELCHKTLGEALRHEGVDMNNAFPRSIFKKAYANELISDDDIWIRLMEDRNSTSHVYDESMADAIAQRIKEHYIPAIGHLLENLRQML